MRIIAPSGPCDRTLFFRALGWLSQRYRLRWSRGSLERVDYLAGSDERRLAELDEALRDRDARAIIAVRGGYGATRICHRADFDALLDAPKWCVGFSDFTAIHIEAWQRGLASMHASNLTALGRGDAGARAEWLHALERPFERRALPSARVLRRGRAEGLLLGGNLSLLVAAATAGRLRLPRGSILFFEEVNEAPYRIDRMLTSLILGGHLDPVAAVCVGDLGDGSRAALEGRALEVVHDTLAPLQVPIIAGLPSGHALVNRPLPLGCRAAVHDDPAELVLNP